MTLETYRLTRLWHQFIRPHTDPTLTEKLAERLEAEGFITRLQDRYAETPKMRAHKHRKELFKIVSEVLNAPFE